MNCFGDDDEERSKAKEVGEKGKKFGGVSSYRGLALVG